MGAQSGRELWSGVPGVMRRVVLCIAPCGPALCPETAPGVLHPVRLHGIEGRLPALYRASRRSPSPPSSEDTC